MLTLVLDNRVRIFGDLPLGVVKALRAECEHLNPKHMQLKRMGFPTYKEPPVIRTWRTEDDHVSFPRGAYRRVREVLDAAALPVRFRDRRARGEPTPGSYEIPDYRRKLRGYQQRALEVIVAREQTIIRAPTGSGKTSLVLAAIAYLKVPALVVVPNSGLFTQWIKRCVDPKELGLRQRDVGIIRASTRRLKPITIAMQKTLAVQGIDDEMRNMFGALFYDEAQLAPAATIFDAIDRWPARYRVAVSADERRKDRKEFLTEDLFTGVGCEITLAECEAADAVIDVEVRCLPTEFDAPWWSPKKQSDISFEELAEEELQPAKEDSVRAKDFDRLVNEMAGDRKREKIVDQCILGEVLQGSQVLVFTRRREHAQVIEQRISSHGIRCGLALGGSGQDERVKGLTIAGLESGEIRVGVGTIDAMGTGIDLPAVEVGVLAADCLSTNRQLFGQVRGRICRKPEGKSKARLYALCDEKVFPSCVSKIASWNKTALVRRDGEWVNAKKRKSRARHS